MGKKNKMKKTTEIRADTPVAAVETPPIMPEIASDVLLKALLGLDRDGMTREKALEIPTVQACLNLISSTISRLPIQLLRKKRNGDIEVIKRDPRVSLLNEDTYDTLTAKQFWRAMIEDYYLGKGGFAYINRRLNQVISINYVREDDVSIGFQNFDPIFKQYEILVQGTTYHPYSFLKLLRKTKDGMKSQSIIEESSLILSVAYAELKFELANSKKGGAKRGFLQAEKNLSPAAIDALKAGYRKLYGDSDENVVILNNGVKFQESSATAAELQMNENKQSNTEEICKLFGIPASMVSGSRTGNSMTENDMAQFTRACVAVMTDIECSLNRDLLLEDEIGKKYFQFDTKELTRGSISERYEAYKIGLEKNFLQIDEVREKEGMEPLGIDWIQMNLNTVLFNPETKEVYTPNTNATANLMTGEGTKIQEQGIQENPDEGSNEQRTFKTYLGKNLIITGAPGSGKTTWAKDHRMEGEIIIDLDAIKVAMTEGGFHDEASDIVPMITVVRDSIYKAISQRKNPAKCYIITTETNMDRLSKWQKILHADLKVMDTPRLTCIDRVMADDSRLDKNKFLELIDRWFSDWERGEKDDSGIES